MRLIKTGTADQSVMIRFLDSTDGSPEAGVVAATAGLAITYRVTGHAAVVLNSVSTPAINDLANLTTAHTDAGLKHVADGWYRFDLPDDAVHEGVTCLVTAACTGMVGFGTVLQLVPFDPQSTTNLGLSALPTANPAANGGLPTVNASNQVAGIAGTKTTLDALNDLAAGAAMTLTSAYDAAKAAASAAAVAALKTILDKVDSMMAADGAVWQLTANALELVPAASATLSEADKTAIAQRAWDDAYVASRRLTQSGAAVAAAVAGSSVTQTRGDTWSIPLTGLGSMTTHSKLWVVLKRNAAEADAESLVMVEHTDGLLYLNGAAPVAPITSASGTLAITDESAGAILWGVDKAATALLPPGTWTYEVQQLTTGGEVTTMARGIFTIDADFVRAYS